MMVDSKRKKVIREDVVRRDGLDCCFCGKQLSSRTATLEHIVPASKRGSFNRSNLTISCGQCNSDRGDKNFFEYLSRFNTTEDKIIKYKNLYINNLKIKVLNIAKEKCILNKFEVPIQLIHKACEILKITPIDLSGIECYFEIPLDQSLPRKEIKYSFERVIKIIEKSLG